MNRFFSVAVPIAILLAMAHCPVQAGTTIVPDDFPTIQAAVDYLANSHGPETLLVRSGDYPEHLVMRCQWLVRGIPSLDGSTTKPRIDSLFVQPSECYQPPGYRFVDLHFARQVVMGPTNGPYDASFIGCRFDRGLRSWDLANYPEDTGILVRRCTVFGDIALRFFDAVVDSSEIHGRVFLNSEYGATVRDNRIERAVGTGLTIRALESHIARNDIRNCGSGIDVFVDEGDVHLEDNRVEDCAGIGIQARADHPTRVFAERNHISRCGDCGLRAKGLMVVRDNRVLDCSGPGLDLVQHEETGIVEGNVVGGCAGDGVRANFDYSGQPTSMSVRLNTVYDCAGAGISISDLAGSTITNNISAFNRGPGLLVARSEPIALGCNDWFANEGGATSGIQPDATDIAVDPLFCDIARDGAQLRSDSPLLDAPGCGRIGALGQGCEPGPIAMEFDLTPGTLNLASRGRWVTGFLEPAAPHAAADIEIGSIRLNDAVPVDRSGPTAIGDHDDDGIPDLMVKFDRAAVQRVLEPGEEVVVTVTGTLDGLAFAGADTIRVIGHGGSGDNGKALTMRAAPPGASPAGRIEVELTLPDAAPARLELLDVAGRVRAFVQVGELGAGQHELLLPSAGTLRQGVYFLRLRQGTSEVRHRAVVIQ